MEELYGVGGRKLTISRCANWGDVTSIGTDADTECGGIVGASGSEALIELCSNYGAVKGLYGRIGGIVGIMNTAAIVSKCSNYGDVLGDTSTASGVGGVAGYLVLSPSTIFGCSSSGTVTGYTDIGGVLGVISNITMPTKAVIESCYNTGEVSSTYYYAGGVVARGRGTIINCYNTGIVTGSGRFGSVVGYTPSTAEMLTVEHSFCIDGTTAFGRQNGPSTIVTLDITQYLASFMKSQGFVDILNEELDTNMWTIDSGKNSGYPIFVWQ